MAGSDQCASHLRRVGRKTLLTAELADQLEQLLQAGVPLSTAVASRGIGQQTFRDWMHRPEPVYAAFRERIEKARANGESVLVARVAEGATESWQAAAWLLERQWPDRWARISQRQPPEEVKAATDPFAEFDELARRRRAH